MHRIGIIGLGTMGKRVEEAMRNHPSFTVAAGFDPTPLNEQFGFILTENPGAVINDPSIDCIYIASPPSSHASLVAEAVSAGKSIFCEKPLSASISDAATCVELVRSSGAIAAVNFPFASAPSAVKLCEILAAAELGQVETVNLTLRFAHWPRGWQTGATGWLAGAAQGGFTREVASHFLFLANRIFGQGTLEQVSVERGEEGTEEALKCIIRYRSASLTIDAAVEGELEDFNRFEVIGSLGTAALTDWYRLEAEQQLIVSTSPMRLQLDALDRMLSGSKNHGLATFEEAAHVVELVEDILTHAPTM